MEPLEVIFLGVTDYFGKTAKAYREVYEGGKCAFVLILEKTREKIKLIEGY